MASLTSTNATAFVNTLERKLTAVPTSPTDVCTTDAMVFQIIVSNTTAGALTITLKDKQATPGQLIPTVSIAANTVIVYDWPEGQLASGGLNITSSGAGLQISYAGRYK